MGNCEKNGHPRPGMSRMLYRGQMVASPVCVNVYPVWPRLPLPSVTPYVGSSRVKSEYPSGMKNGGQSGRVLLLWELTVASDRGVVLFII